jgi:hypothetical protein
MKHVLFMPEVRQYYNSLVPLLHNLEYFGHLDGSRKYVKELVEDIMANLPNRQHKSAPEYFDKYEKNMFYATFRKNRQTTWYAFFTKYDLNGDTIYLVHYLANNHTVAQHL